MPDIWMDVDTAVTVPVNFVPLIDDTDFKTLEDAVAYNATGMALYWHFETCAGVKSVTAVTPSNSGNYLWTDEGTTGTYKIQIPASGGATINNDTEGFGYFTGKCTGVLAWRSPSFGFRASGLNDLMIESAYSTTRGLSGTALPAAAADAAGGLIISDAGGLDADDLKADVTAILSDTGTDGVPLTAGAVDAVLDEVVEGTITLRQALRLVLSFISGECSGGGTTTVTFRDIGDSKDRIVMTVDASGNRSAIGTRDGT